MLRQRQVAADRRRVTSDGQQGRSAVVAQAVQQRPQRDREIAGLLLDLIERLQADGRQVVRGGAQGRIRLEFIPIAGCDASLPSSLAN